MSVDDQFDGLPVGTILLWTGDVQHLRDGWFLCDGANGTVQLVNRIPLGAAASDRVNVGPAPALPNAPEGANRPEALRGETTCNVVYGARNPSDNANNNWQGMGWDHTHPLPVNRIFFIQKVRGAH
jgi:hypothetical protein